MEQQVSVWRVALGAMLGNIGCFVAYLLFSCIIIAVLMAMGGSLPSILRNLPAGLH